jgi:CelD/BcsL family acetyltransferase involved in cellulose biosynthesis
MAITSSLPTSGEASGGLRRGGEILPSDALQLRAERSIVTSRRALDDVNAGLNARTAPSVSTVARGPLSPIKIERHENLDLLAQEWDELAARAQAAPWLRPGWIAAWWRAFGQGQLEILAIRKDGRLAAVLPLYRRFGALHSATNWHTPQFGLLAEDEGATQDLTRALFAHRRRRINVGFLGGDDLRACSTAATAAGYRPFVRPIQRSPYVPIAGTWAEYKQRLSAKRLSEIRRRRRLLEGAGRLSLQIVDGSERLAEFLEEGFGVEAAGWKGEGGSAIISRPQTRQFYSEVAHWGAARGVLRLAFLRLDGRPLAFDYCLEEGNVHYLVKTGYDPAYRALGPGLILRYEMLARAFDTGLASYEFLGTDQPWKLEWADQFHEQVLLRTFGPTPCGVLEWTAFAYGRPLAKRLLTLVHKS